jgi:thiol-disulfide isomerase/thioredoxin
MLKKTIWIAGIAVLWSWTGVTCELPAAACSLPAAACSLPAAAGSLPAAVGRQDVGGGKVAPTVVEPPTAGLGQGVPNLLATDIQGRAFNLRRYAAGSPVVVVLTSTSCPLCKKYGPTLAALEQEFAAAGVKFVFIGAIAADDLAAAEEVRQELGLMGPYLLDRNQELVAALGAESTTEAFFLDPQLRLQYRGAVDDQYGLGYTKPAPQRQYLREAIQQWLANQTVAVPQTTAPGCKILASVRDAHRPLQYHRDVARIVQNHCLECHRDQGVAPFELDSAESLIAHAGMIIEVVENRTMPPWFAAVDTQQPHRWVNDAALTDTERETLIAWLRSEQSLGNPQEGPVARVFDSQWSIEEPNLVVQLPERNRVQRSGYMDYLHQKIPLTHEEDLWIEAVEIRPTAREVVHHVLLYAIERNSRQLEVDERSHFLAAYAPGNAVQEFGPGFAKKLPANHDLVAQLHYTPNGQATYDQTEIAFRVSRQPPRHEILVTGIANTQIKIPPGAANHPQTANLVVPQRAVLTAFFPHMHVRGKSFRVELLRPNGERDSLLEVPRYDFNWQLEYRLLNPLEVEVGNEILVTGWFDNSAENPSNPAPDKEVTWGPQTDEEMLIGYVEYYFLDDDSSPLQQAKRRATPEEAFARMDRNRDGQLSRDEFARPAAFDAVDADGDGSLSREEFQRAWSRSRRR